ncbi:DUF4175 family protein [Sporocytophaga myxococcoides]|uniref:DUF4175 family protein n=1 Tax=Sporocytophaga myxococcoides TaxID=153721 RepID=UPI000425F558|nr:DUF4175 family protein [Sporocytophaga myxococcoides]
MKPAENFDKLLVNLKAYKRKYYLNQMLKGGILFLTLLSSTYLFFSILEYYGKFSQIVRVIFFFTYLISGSLAFFTWILDPLLKYFAINKQLSDEEASRQIGLYFPEIKDKLLNTLQLKKMSEKESELIRASIEQKTNSLSIVPFSNAINIKENKRYLRYLVGPIVIIALIVFFLPHIFVESTARIINYNIDFKDKAPFAFMLENKSLKAFKNEDFEINLSIKGNSIPESVYLISANKRSKLKNLGGGKFSYLFKNIQRKEDFNFEAAGFISDGYSIDLINRPELTSFDVYLNYPSYLKKQSEKVKNIGNLSIPEGTSVTWEFNTKSADQIKILFSTGKQITENIEDDAYKLSKTFNKTESYDLELQNKQVKSKEKISYTINVIPDQFPQISSEEYHDSTLFNFISLGGSINDDYGLTGLRLFYKRSLDDNKEKESPFKSINVPIDQKFLSQNFIFNWNIDSLNLKPGESLDYYLQVWDNDGVNGRKSSKSKTYGIKLPSKEEASKAISKNSSQTENKMEKALSKSQQIQKDLNKIEEKLKGKNNLNWQDKKSIEELLDKHEELRKEIEELKKANEKLNQQQDKLSPSSEEMAKKMEQLQKLMNELLDEETKKLYDELQKLMEKNAPKQDLQKVLDAIQKKENNMDKELERALEMFKQLKFDQKSEEIINDLKETAKEQEELAEKTNQKQEDQKSLQQQQEKLNEDFKNIQEKLNDLEKINESLENKNDLENTDSKENEISNEQQNSSEQLKNNQNKKAGNSQKNAAEKMKEMADKLSSMQKSNEQEQAEENMEDLRMILENLVRLSFDQEDVMKEFKKVNQTDPRFIALSQKQLKLKDDSKIIEDSLLALAKRVYQIESFVTREVGQMKDFMDESAKAIKERRPDIAAGKQQFAMTSINNLALMLNDVLKQMQEQMAQSMKSGSSMCKKPGKNPKPGLGELQKQLNQKIQQLKQGGKTGKELSEELAKLAAEQETIRNAMKELEKMMNKNGGQAPGNNLNQLSQKMEETENDLVNKKLTQEMIMRQQEILTRLLEAEKAVRERDLDEKREAESAKEPKQDIPPSFEKYLKAKERQIDLLKSISPALTPYYKQEVNEYFQKIDN